VRGRDRTSAVLTGHAGRMDQTDRGAQGNDERAASRAEPLLPEEETAGSDDPRSQADAILEESDVRSEDRSASPGTVLEHRTSDEATKPLE
jgi:hypothetical protein